jgi:hypothetical protein
MVDKEFVDVEHISLASLQFCEANVTQMPVVNTFSKLQES